MENRCENVYSALQQLHGPCSNFCEDLKVDHVRTRLFALSALDVRQLVSKAPADSNAADFSADSAGLKKIHEKKPVFFLWKKMCITHFEGYM